MKKSYWILFLTIVSCSVKPTEKKFPEPSLAISPEVNTNVLLTREQYYDKVLGMLVGSAIGDAMGAPTEMWDRKAIETQKGYVDSLDLLVRERSPEGPWLTNMSAGSTTDDTRWKYLTIHYLLTQRQDSLSPIDFARFIMDTYERERVEMLNSGDSYEQLDRNFSHLTWLIEWQKVAKPFVEGNLMDYNSKLSKFYGGEMSCAGMLYAPAIGACFPGMPLVGYKQAYNLSIFDIGYARDITALTSAFVSKAMQPGVSINEITLITREVDPEKYFESRLIGRMAYKALEQAKIMTAEAQKMTEKDIPANLKLPSNFKHGALYYSQLQKVYSMLEHRLQDVAFHAAEIHLINLTALEFTNGDFEKAIEFVTNFGRDNDTVAAVTGAILGAYWGYDKLPTDMAAKVVKTSREIVGIDLEELARNLVDHRLGIASK